MSKTESIVAALFIALIVPAASFMLGWWGSASLFLFIWKGNPRFVPDYIIPKIAFTGLAIGILFDILFLKRWAKNVYNFGRRLLICVYVFFSIVTLGLFMGVPLFNSILGIIAGIYAGRRLRYLKVDRGQLREKVRKVSVFTSAMMFSVCCFSACLALADPHTPENLKKMLGIQFEVTKGMVVALIFIGAILLVLLQYWLTKKAALISYQLGSTRLTE